jgi:DNA-binding MarR family transcriptional regulator
VLACDFDERLGLFMKIGKAKLAVSQSVDSRQEQSGALYDNIEASWARERPDLNLGTACTMLRLEGANHLHQVRVQAISKKIGIHPGDLYVLLALRRAGKPYELRPTDLFRSLLVTSGAITKRIARLQDVGFVLRVSANNDGRSELVRLTGKGVAATDRAISEIAQVVDYVTAESQLTSQEISVLDRCLRKLLTVGTAAQPPKTKNLKLRK